MLIESAFKCNTKPSRSRGSQTIAKVASHGTVIYFFISMKFEGVEIDFVTQSDQMINAATKKEKD